jgi:hypothetical protein
LLSQQKAKSVSDSGDDKPSSFYSIMYHQTNRKKKGKTWLDGLLEMNPRLKRAIICSMDGKVVTKVWDDARETLLLDDVVEFGNYTTEIMATVDPKEVLSGRFFLADSGVASATQLASKSSATQKPFLPHSRSAQSNAQQGGSSRLVARGKAKQAGNGSIAPQQPVVVPPGALVLQKGGQRTGGGQSLTTPVFLEPTFNRLLREHQREGLRFLWMCAEGRQHQGRGAILADEMGLGKTLQCLVLITVFLEQSVAGRVRSRDPRRRCIVVCPSGVVSNWGNEFKKWVQPRRMSMKPLLIDGKGKAAEQQCQHFARGNGEVSPVLILSYEMYR